MKYKVEAYRSLSLCRAYAVMEHRHEPMYWGPYKSLKFARKKATELRKDRCLITVQCCSDGPDGPAEYDHEDCGPSFVKVKVIEVSP